jgi:hypothetical protein
VTGPAAEGVRVAWPDVPQDVRAGVEQICGAPVLEARTQPGGFSPGVAARLRCADGGRYFVKAVSAEANAESPDMHRREARVLAALDTMLHIDVRADNLLLAGGRVFVVDWPHACRGAAFVEPVLLAPSVAMQGGPAPSELLARSRAGGAAGRPAVAAVVCAMAGYLTERSLRPPPPGLPTVRAFQAAQGEIARRWLADLLR